MQLVPDQEMDMLPFPKVLNQIIFMFPDPLPILLGSGLRRNDGMDCPFTWFPASAGMTDKGWIPGSAGMTELTMRTR